MGLFGNNRTNEFKNKFVDIWNLLANYSYGHLTASRETSMRKIEISFQELKEIARRYSDPFSEYFNMISQSASVFGEKTSIAKGICIVYLAINAISQGQQITISAHNAISAQAESICSSYQGRKEVQNIINS